MGPLVKTFFYLPLLHILRSTCLIVVWLPAPFTALLVHAVREVRRMIGAELILKQDLVAVGLGKTAILTMKLELAHRIVSSQWFPRQNQGSTQAYNTPMFLLISLSARIRNQRRQPSQSPWVNC